MSFHKARQWEEGGTAWFSTLVWHQLHNLEKGRGLTLGKNRSRLYFGLGVFGVKGQKGLNWLPLRRWPRTPPFLFMVNVAAAKAFSFVHFEKFALNLLDTIWKNRLGAFVSLYRPCQWTQYWVLDQQHIHRHRSQSTSFSRPDWCRLLNAAHFEWAASCHSDPVSHYHSGPAREGDELFSNARPCF